MEPSARSAGLGELQVDFILHRFVAKHEAGAIRLRASCPHFKNPALARYACYCFVYGHGKMIAINFLQLGQASARNCIADDRRW